jgi:hypothetical protein
VQEQEYFVKFSANPRNLKANRWFTDLPPDFNILLLAQAAFFTINPMWLKISPEKVYITGQLNDIPCRIIVLLTGLHSELSKF